MNECTKMSTKGKEEKQIQGDFASGDQSRNIHLYRMHEGGTWVVDQRALNGHSGSVEDVHWSPTEEGLLASCSVDGTIKLWDVRSSPADACVCTVEKVP
ncbi:WD domain, G-beta repeat protein [Teladorsagia circumcincta]|uniref:WD domain, G-beta repeat protein n=1 Tax=Teladorsagia circumcincta TaxID=45464 RepID=A0A2G9TC56_TELCI|nr:WD domain, G-beta repeat protein [Teladorsagia circumcincta]